MDLKQHLSELEQELQEDIKIDEYFTYDENDNETSSNRDYTHKYAGFFKLPSHKRASRVKSIFPDNVEVQGQYIYIMWNVPDVMEYMDNHKIKYIPVEPTGMGDSEKLSNRERGNQLPMKFSEDQIDEASWDVEDTEIDGFKVPTVKAVDLDSPEGQILDKGQSTNDHSRWKDTPKPDNIDKDTEWLGDLEIDADAPDDLSQMKKMAGIKQPESKSQEYNKDWYWHDSEGNVVKDTWGNPIKSGSHPDSQKKQPWDFFSDDVDSEVGKEQLNEKPWWDDDSIYNDEVNALRSKEKPANTLDFDFGDTGDAADRLDNLKNWRKDSDMPKSKADTRKYKAPEGPFKSDSASIDKPWYHDAYGDSTGTSANYKADMTPQDVDVPERPPVKSVDITKKTEKPAKQPVQTKPEPKPQSWWEKQKAQHKAQNPDQYDSKGRQITKNPITGEPNVQWGEKRPESEEGKHNRLERERKAKAYQDKVKKAGGHLNKFGQDVKNMFSADSYNKAKADHKKKMADRKKLSKHEQNLARLRDLGLF